VSEQEFNDKYRNGSIQALSSVTGAPASDIAVTTAKPAGHRRSLQQAAGGTSTAADFVINSADPAATRGALDAALANNGEKLFAALSAAGVPTLPSISGPGITPIAAPKPPAAPAAGGTDRNVLIGVLVGVLGGLLLIAILGFIAWKVRKSRRATTTEAPPTAAAAERDVKKMGQDPSMDAPPRDVSPGGDQGPGSSARWVTQRHCGTHPVTLFVTQ
jgi:hypothetical protein